ncbi:7-carboxy-7-deazaguanine synthase QueE [candidate division KSB1 bacterium]
MKINEIYKSIQGESIYLGIPTLFIRTAECNLRCSYCDTPYAYEDGKDFSIDDLLVIIENHNVEFIEITGGEPLLQEDTPILIEKLLQNEHLVAVETNGTKDIGLLPAGSYIIMDIKCPSSGQSKKTEWRNIDKLKKTDQVKFVIGTRNDYEWAKGIMEKTNLTEKAIVLLSAVFEELKAETLINWILEDNLNVRFQPQLHKFIWGANIKGK